ncbi:unnamed protein product, partial [Ixodes persulcatus]
MKLCCAEALFRLLRARRSGKTPKLSFEDGNLCSHIFLTCPYISISWQLLHITILFFFQ